MGDLDIDMEPSYGTKHVANSQFTHQQFSQRLNGLDQEYTGQPNFPSHVARDSDEIEKVIWRSLLVPFQIFPAVLLENFIGHVV
jgi:hypothetical protein